MAMAMQIYSTKDNQWREYFNPLRGLSIPRMVSLLEAGERGQYADLQWCYYYMERSDSMIFSVLQRRRAALLDCDWNVRQVAPEPGVFRHAGRRLRIAGPVDDVLAQEQVDCLRAVYDGIENFDAAVSFLFTGVSRGFAHLEKNYGTDGEIVRLEPVEQWFWLRDGMFADWEYNQNAVSGRRRGLPIEPDNFLILETTPLNRMLSLLYLRRVISQRDWDAYLNVYGIPPVFFIGPPNAVGDKEKEYQVIAENLFSDGRGYLPNGSDIKFVNGGGGRPPYREQMEYVDRQITLLATGGLLTMLTESGSGTLAGGAHSDTFQQIARGDASTVSDVFQRGIDLPVLAENFPGQPVLAFFQFAPTTLGAASAVAQDVAALAAAGFTVDPAQVSEKTGYRAAPVVAATPVVVGKGGTA
jgi:phage gp29-like protein